MSFIDQIRKAPRNPQGLSGGKAQGPEQDPAQGLTLEPELQRVLENYRLSVHAWSEAAYHRPRRPAEAARPRKAWRLAAAWTLGIALVAGGVSGGVFERQHRQELARMAAQREADRQKQLVAERAREEEELLARVDSDVSRQVPSAMEPLAQLMLDDDKQ
jgi:hypothetical protein